MPGIPRIARTPGFTVCRDQLAVLGIAEFDGDDIGTQCLAVRIGRDPGPVLAGIGRMVKSAGGATHPGGGLPLVALSGKIVSELVAEDLSVG